MKLFLKLIEREFRMFGSNTIAVLIFIGAPILYALLVGSVYKEATIKDLPIIIVDLDNSPLSNKVIDALDDNMFIKVAEVRNISGNLKDEVINKNYMAVVTIPESFEANIQQRRYSEIDADINGSNMLTANYASTGIQTVLSTLNAGLEIETLKKKGIPTEIASQQYESFKINITRFFNPSANYLLFLWPGMLGTIMQQVFLLALALSFSKEFEDDTFRNLVRYSKSASYLLLVKSLPYWLMGVALWLPLIRGFFALFHVEMMNSMGGFYIVSALFILSLTFLGIAASIIFNTQLKATEVLMIIATPSFIISGQTWPLAQMPNIVQTVANYIPLTHYLEAFRRLLLYNASISEIAPQIHALIWLTLIYLIIALIALKYRVVKQKRLNCVYEVDEEVNTPVEK
jgi:ABC-2 type transport system permease protein